MGFDEFKEGVKGSAKKLNPLKLVKKPFSKVSDFSKAQTNKMSSDPDQPEVFDVVIIGAGVAGMTAAIYASRRKMKTLLVCGEKNGGKLTGSGAIGEWPGEVRIEGEDLANNLVTHAKRIQQDNKNFDLWIRENEQIKEVKQDDDKVFVCTSDNKDTVYKAKTVICATGSKVNTLGIAGEEKGREAGKGVVFEAMSDPALFTDKKVVVLGGNKESALLTARLSSFADNVTLVTKEESTAGAEGLFKKVASMQNVDFKPKTEVKEILLNGTTGKVRGVKLVENGGNAFEFECDTVYESLGSQGNTEFLGEFVKVGDDKKVVVNDKRMASVDGFFAVGDCATNCYDEVIPTANCGAVAAIEAFEYVINA